MKIGVISDTHIPERARELPQIVLDEFKKVDMIIHAGDFVDVSVLNKLKSICANVKAVWGNMDPTDLRKLLPEKEVFGIGNFKIGLMHGFGPPAKLTELLASIFKDDIVNLIIFGHSHAELNEKIGDILFFNPGSPTDKIFSPHNSYGIIEINDKIEAKIIRL